MSVISERWPLKDDTTDNHPDILTEAKRIVEGPRRIDYDTPERNLQQTADLWNAYLFRKLSAPIDAKDVALCMALVKFSRESFTHTHDNLLDAVGYIACADRIEKGNQ